MEKVLLRTQLAQELGIHAQAEAVSGDAVRLVFDRFSNQRLGRSGRNRAADDDERAALMLGDRLANRAGSGLHVGEVDPALDGGRGDRDEIRVMVWPELGGRNGM